MAPPSSRRNAAKENEQPANGTTRRQREAPFFGSEAYHSMALHERFKYRLEGPITQVVLRESRTDSVKIPTPRRVVMNWSQVARSCLSGRSRQGQGKGGGGATVVCLPDWASEEGVRWLLTWMETKCRKEDADERLMTRQFYDELPPALRELTPLVAGVPVLDGDDLAMVLACHNAAVALRLPRNMNKLQDHLVQTTARRPMDAREMKAFWDCCGRHWQVVAFQNTLVPRLLENQVRHMLAGVPGDYEAIESLAEGVPALEKALSETMAETAGGGGLVLREGSSDAVHRR